MSWVRKIFFAICALFLVAAILLMIIVLPGVKPNYTAGSNALFVREVALAITKGDDTADLFLPGNSDQYDLSAEPIFQPAFSLPWFTANADPDDPSLIHYSCYVSGPGSACYSMLNNKLYPNVGSVSPWIQAEGTVRVRTYESGERRIELGDGKNVFALYVSLRYMPKELLTARGVRLPANSENASTVLRLIALQAALAYGNTFGIEPVDFFNKTLVPEVNKMASTTTWRQGAKAGGPFGALSAYYRSQIPVKSALLILFIVCASFSPAAMFFLYRKNYVKEVWNLKSNKSARYSAARELSYHSEKKQIIKIACEHPEPEIRSVAVDHLSHNGERDLMRRIAETDDSVEVRERAVYGLRFPDDRDSLEKAAIFGAYNAAEMFPPDDPFLVKIVEETQNERAARVAILKLSHEKYKEQLNRFARTQRIPDVRCIAINALEYPEDRDTLIAVLREDEDPACRRAALGELSVPEDIDVITEAVMKEKEYSVITSETVQKLRYPEDKMLLRTIADGDFYGSSYARQMLPEADDAEAIHQQALNDPQADRRMFAIKALRYPQDRDTLIKASKQDKVAENRLYALQSLSYPEDHEALAYAALNDPEHEIRLQMLQRLSYDSDRETLVKVALQSSRPKKDRDQWPSDPTEQKSEIMAAIEKLTVQDADIFAQLYSSEYVWSSDTNQLRAVISIALHPEYGNDLMDSLCRQIEQGIRESRSAVTLAGWSAVALGRILARRMKPTALDANKEALADAINRRNEIIEEMKPLQEIVKPYLGTPLHKLPIDVRNVYSKLSDLSNTVERGLGCFMLDRDDLPFYYLIQLLKNQQQRIPRFVRQGVIMGLVDWLSENAADPDVKPLLETVIKVRADIIRSDNELSFFEVRVPDNCTEEEYALLLDDVLHCSNPALQYVPAAELLKVAKLEVPGCMDMLRACPLRLIDPVNRKTLGFYQFDPFVHAMWTQYRPPIDTGEVISRFHEVDDRTKPLSSGLNLKLFLDPWSVIPTLYHEHEHFAGDPNEASVFLKTQVFSIGFYRKYRQADASSDGVFARMTEELGMPPRREKLSALNELIRQFYGEQHTQKEAIQLAEEQLMKLNMMIKLTNMSLKWDPKITFPLLDEGGDEANRDLIHEITVRFAMVPKSITEDEFDKIVS